MVLIEEIRNIILSRLENHKSFLSTMVLHDLINFDQNSHRESKCFSHRIIPPVTAVSPISISSNSHDSYRELSTTTIQKMY